MSLGSMTSKKVSVFLFLLFFSFGHRMPAKPLSDEQLEDAERLRTVLARSKAQNPSLTHKYISEKCGWTSQGALSQYATGRIPLNLKALAKLSKILRVEPAEISPRLAAEYPYIWTPTSVDPSNAGLVEAVEILQLFARLAADQRQSILVFLRTQITTSDNGATSRRRLQKRMRKKGAF